MRFHIMTLFPEIFNSYFGESIMKRAIEKGIIEVFVYNIRDFSANKHKKVDDYPFGGNSQVTLTQFADIITRLCYIKFILEK